MLTPVEYHHYSSVISEVPGKYSTGISVKIQVKYHRYSIGVPPLFQCYFRGTCKIFHRYISGNPTIFPVEYCHYSSGISEVPVEYPNGISVVIFKWNSFSSTLTLLDSQLLLISAYTV